jgi:hypothetical protein
MSQTNLVEVVICDLISSSWMEVRLNPLKSAMAFSFMSKSTAVALERLVRGGLIAQASSMQFSIEVHRPRCPAMLLLCLAGFHGCSARLEQALD